MEKERDIGRKGKKMKLKTGRKEEKRMFDEKDIRLRKDRKWNLCKGKVAKDLQRLSHVGRQ